MNFSVRLFSLHLEGKFVIEENKTVFVANSISQYEKHMLSILRFHMTSESVVGLLQLKRKTALFCNCLTCLYQLSCLSTKLFGNTNIFNWNSLSAYKCLRIKCILIKRVTYFNTLVRRSDFETKQRKMLAGGIYAD